MVPITYNIRSLVVRKTTTLAALFGIALVVFVFSAVNMLSLGIQKTLGSSGRSDNAVVLRKGSDAELTSSIEEPLVGLMRANDAVARSPSGDGLGVGEIVVVATLDKTGTSGVSNVLIRGVPENVYEFRPEVTMVAGRKARPGTDEVVVGKSISGRFQGVDLGKTFELKKNRPVTVVGVFTAAGSSFESEVWGDLDTIRNAFGRQGLVSAVRVRLTSATRLDAFKLAVESDKRLGLAVEREDVYYEKQSSMMAGFFMALGIAIAVFCSFGAMIGAAITMYAQVANRTREVGTLRALGFSRRSILSSFMLESLFLALAGGLIGALASMLMGFVKFSTVNWASWSEVVFSFEARPSIILGSLVFAAFLGAVGGFLPALRAARVSPVEAMRG
jgi:putative ABC transport system permease protein